MAGPITTGAHPKLLWPGIRKIWGYTYSDWESQYTDLADTVDSDKAYEEYVQVAGFGLPTVKPQGQSVTFDTETQFTVTRLTNVTYAAAYMVTMEELMDDKYPEVSDRRARNNARSMQIGKEFFVANMYNQAFNGAILGGDNQPLGSLVHPLAFGGTQANVPTTPVDLSQAALEDAWIQIAGLLDDRGLPIHLMPRTLHVSRSEYFNALRILTSDYQSDNANNAVNVLKTQNIFPGGIKLNIYFTSARPWFIRTNVEDGTGLVFQQRMAARFDRDNDFDTKNLKASAIERYQVGWADYRGIFAVNAP